MIFNYRVSLSEIKLEIIIEKDCEGVIDHENSLSCYTMSN